MRSCRPTASSRTSSRALGDLVMSRVRRCPYCDQELPEIRLGVRLPPLKARLFDLVQRGGGDGITGSDLFDILYPDGNASRETLKAHVFQINERGSVYRLVRFPCGPDRRAENRPALTADRSNPRSMRGV
jgi:hypothetical protein